MAKEENIHAGHRERLLDTVIKCGIDNISEVQAVEFILCYIFPRGDVNPLAHRLLEKYRNIPTILEASIEDLASVKGMGTTSAKKIHALLDIYGRYTLDKMLKQSKLSTLGEIYDYIEALLRFKKVEELHLLGVNAKGEVIADRLLAKGSIKNVAIELRDVSLFVSTYKVPGVIFVHNHPDGFCQASQTDIIANEKLENVFKFAGCRLLDNLIVGSDGIYSIHDKGVKRKFVELDFKQFENTNGNKNKYYLNK